MRVRLEIELLEIFEAYKAADIMTLLVDIVGFTCVYEGSQRVGGKKFNGNFSGSFGGPEGLSYLQLQKMIYKKSL